MRRDARNRLLVAALAWLATAWCGPASTALAEMAEAQSYATQQRNLRFTDLDSAKGLSQDSVMALTQDKQGFIWIGTQEGLNRYDGHQITVFERDRQNENSLSHNWVWCLSVANDGTLWIGTDGGGISLYDTVNDSFRTIQSDPNNTNTISSNRIRALHQDRAGNYWVGTVNAGLNRIDGETGAVQRYRFDPEDQTSLPHDSVLTILEDRRGRVWIGTDGGGLARFDRASNGFVRYQPNDNEYSLSGRRVAAVAEDRDGALWIGTRDGGVNRFDTPTGKFIRFTHDPDNPLSLSNNRVFDILEDSDGTLWISTDGGLNEWRPTVGGFSRYVADDGDISSLSDSQLTDLFQSSDGVVWVGSFRGVNSWNYMSDAFTHFREGTGSLNVDVVTSFGETSDGVLWVGTYGGGINRIDRFNRELSAVRHDPDNPKSLSDDRVMVLFVDSEDIIWAGTRGKGLNRHDPTTGETRQLSTPELSSPSISALYGEPDGTMWIGTFGGGLNRIDPDGTVRWFQHDKKDPTSIGGNRVLSIIRDRVGTLWVGTEQGGLNRFDPVTEAFKRFQHDPDNPNSLSSNAAWEVVETSDGSLWVATKNDGINQWRAEDRAAGHIAFRRWTKADGLRSNQVYGLLEDDFGHLWLSSNRGISRINIKDPDIRHYDRRNGLIGDEFNFGARFRSRTGEFLFGGLQGAVAFVPGQIRRNTNIPPVVLWAYSPIERLAVRYSGSTRGQTAVVKYTDNYVAFEFAALDYTSPDKNEFRYMLEGFDETWQNPGNMRRITYANLAPGTYLFRVKAANNDAVWNEKGAVLTVVVEPAPWQTVWAYGGYALILAITALALLRQLKNRRAREVGQREELEEEVRQRTHELGERNRQLEEVNDKLMEASFTDSLTGLYNRRYLDQFIDYQVSIVDRESHSKREADSADFEHYQQTVLFFMMIDLDGFKAINDSHGHVAGDRALLQVRDELLDCARQSDTIIRWGGDEFLIVGQTKGVSGIANFAERVRLAIGERVYDLGNGHNAELSCSVGAVPYPLAPLKTELLNWEQSLNVADAGAYIVKANGRNGWFVLNGTADLDAADAARLPGAIEPLVTTGKLQFSTSLSQPDAILSSRQSVA